jgi:hypothetical protein
MDRERCDDTGIALKVNRIAFIIKKYKDEWRDNISRKTSRILHTTILLSTEEIMLLP